MFRRLLIALGCATALAAAQDPSSPQPVAQPPPATAVEPAKPVIERVDDTRFRIGTITFDQTTREIRFPATVNMIEGNVEYAIVKSSGKVHESLLVTDISVTHLNVAFTLLRYPPSRELYALPNKTGGLSDKFPTVPAATKTAARVQVKIEWDDAGKPRCVPINEWIQHTRSAAAMPAGLWVYGGSDVHQGKFVAEATGEIMAIFLSNSALINYPGKDNADDTVWIPFPKRVPIVGTKVTVCIAPNPGLPTTPATQPRSTP